MVKVDSFEGRTPWRPQMEKEEGGRGSSGEGAKDTKESIAGKESNEESPESDVPILQRDVPRVSVGTNPGTSGTSTTGPDIKESRYEDISSSSTTSTDQDTRIEADKEVAWILQHQIEGPPEAKVQKLEEEIFRLRGELDKAKKREKDEDSNNKAEPKKSSSSSLTMAHYFTPTVHATTGSTVTVTTTTAITTMAGQPSSRMTLLSSTTSSSSMPPPMAGHSCSICNYPITSTEIR